MLVDLLGECLLLPGKGGSDDGHAEQATVLLEVLENLQAVGSGLEESSLIPIWI